MSTVRDDFYKLGVIRGGLLLLRPPDALQLIRRCKQLGLPVLGVDGFFLTATTTQPSMEYSIDLSGSRKPPSIAESWDMAEAFVTKRLATDLFFEVAIEE